MVVRSWRIMSRIHGGQNGMTGLETAIILIAFVTVAAVFGYAVLGAGLFSAERSKETIYAGLKEARSNLELSGSVTGIADTGRQELENIRFSLKNAIAGQPIDMTPCNGTPVATNKCAISLITAADYMSNVKWSRTPTGADDGDNLLEPGEQIEIGIDLNDLGNGNQLSENLTTYSVFDVQVKPSIGSTVTIQRTLPASLAKAMDLH
jgi:flagellin FlaB